MNRRQFIKNSTVAALGTLSGLGCATTRTATNKPLSADQGLILAGTKGALEKSLYPALRERAYPGHFMVTVDGGTYGSENTWPGLDSWEIAGAFLLTGRRREVLDYFDFVQ